MYTKKLAIDVYASSSSGGGGYIGFSCALRVSLFVCIGQHARGYGECVCVRGVGEREREGERIEANARAGVTECADLLFHIRAASTRASERSSALFELRS